MILLILGHLAVAVVSLAGGVAVWCLLTADPSRAEDNDWPRGWWFWGLLVAVVAAWVWLQWSES